MRRFSPFHSIRGRLLLLAVGVELVMLSLLVTNSIRLQQDAMTTQVEWQLQQMMPVLNAALKAPLAQLDYATVQAVLDESRATEGVEYVVVTSRTGEIVASSGWKRGETLPKPSSRQSTFSFTGLKCYDQVLPIELSGQQLGTLHLGLNLSHIITARRILLSQGIGIAITGLVLSSIILALIGYWLTRHLTTLTNASLEVARGNLSPPAQPEGDDDIGRLGAAFNTMSRVIAERLAELTVARDRAEAGEVRLKCITESAKDAILMMNPNGEITFWNPAAERILGYRAEEALGHNLHDLLAPERYLADHHAAFAAFVRTGQGAAVGKTLDIYAIHKDGREIPVSLSLSAAWQQDAWHAVGILHDITERRQAQIELAAKQRQLEELNRSLQQRVDDTIAELRRKDQVLISQGRQAAMGEMIGNIAHQWRQPLNALSMLISNIQFTQMNDELTEEYLNESAATADRLIKKMSTTINDFRNFFNPDKEKVPFSARQQILQAVELVDAAFKNSNITLTLEVEHDCRLYGFPNEYSQVLLNLLTNARDAIVERRITPGQISISLATEGQMGVVTVRDNGGGIPEELLEKIFEPYFSTKQMGTGIGLYMSKMIIERNMGGNLAAHTREGGSELVIHTPLKEQVL